MSGSGPAADPEGNIFILDANGTFDTTLDERGHPSHGNYGNSFVKITTTNDFSVADYFTMLNVDNENEHDTDLGSGGAVVLPDLTDADGKVRHLAVGGGKDRGIYLVDRENMGKFNPSSNDIYQQINELGGAIFSTPAYFNQAIYYGALHDSIKRFPFVAGRLAETPASQTTIVFGYPGVTPTISGDGGTDAILWAAENGSTARSMPMPLKISRANFTTATKLAEVETSSERGTNTLRRRLQTVECLLAPRMELRCSDSFLNRRDRREAELE